MISAIESAAGKCNAAIYQLKVVLLDSKQPVWRHLQVPGDASLEEIFFRATSESVVPPVLADEAR